MPRFFFFIPGIFQHPAGNDDWSDRACDYVEAHCPGDFARDYEYRCGIFKTPGQARRCARVRDYLNAFADCDRIVTGHSNGCDIALKTLATNPLIKVKALHLVAAATPAHCGTNGLNEIARRGQVQEVHLYVSKNDRILLAGWLSYELFGWVGRGFGDLGLEGPLNIGPDLAPILTIHQDDTMGHSDWLRGDSLYSLLWNMTR